MDLCPECGEIFPTPEKLEYHMAEAHPREEVQGDAAEAVRKYGSCYKGSQDYEDYLMAIRGYQRAICSAFKCMACSESFDDVDEAQDHYEKEHKNRFRCDKCSWFVTPDKAELLEHMTRIHDGKLLTEEVRLSDFEDVDEGSENPVLAETDFVDCNEINECNEKDLSNDKDMRTEYHDWMSNEEILVPALSRKDFMKKSVKHFSRFKCRFCLKLFVCLKDLVLHKYSFHPSGDEYYRCNECSFSCKRFLTFAKHRRLKHKVEKPYECEYCSFCIQTKTRAFQHHVKKSHKQTLIEEDIYAKGLAEKVDEGFELETTAGESESDASEDNDCEKLNCKVCEFKCRNWKSFAKHIINTHHLTASNCFWCEETNEDGGLKWKKCHMQSSLHQNNILNVRLVCDICSEPFVDIDTCLKHYKYHRKTESFKYLCNKCSYASNIFENFKVHFINSHLIKETLCNLCNVNARFPVEENWMEKHTISEEHKAKILNFNHFCSLCYQPAVNLNGLRRHCMHHHEELNCRRCKFVATSVEEMNEHLCSKETLAGDRRDSRRQPRVRVQCEECGIFFRREDECNAHKRENHREDQPWLQCKQCGIYTATKKEMNVHVSSVHEGKGDPDLDEVETHKDFNDMVKVRDMDFQTPYDLTCQECGHVSVNKWRLSRHIAEAHRKNNLYECDFCDFKHTAISKFQLHMRRKHQGKKSQNKDKAFECNICKKLFEFKQALERHRTNIHENRREFCCHLCDRTFAASSTLRYHTLEVHEKKLAHKCPDCNFATANPAKLREHIFTQHRSYSNFQCQLCDKRFKRPSFLRSHMKNVHQNEKLTNE